MIKIMKYGAIPNAEIFARVSPAANVEKVVADIIADVRSRGDRAVLDYALKFDGAQLDTLAVTAREMEEAWTSVEPEFLAVMEQAAENIRAFHSCQKRNSFVISEKPGVVLGQKVTPMEKVGVYVPGGTAALASTVLMDVIPARIAGCPQIITATPSGKDGKVAPAVLAAARIAGVDRIFKMGGAQAVAAMAYGTESVPKVDKIVGPGNAFVAEAKKQVFGQVSIDMIAGPSEILIVADGKSDPVHVAADMLSQAEHDRLASAVLVTDSQALACAVSRELERQIPLLPRAEIARASVDSNGKIIVTEDLMTGIAIANEIAPEHLELMVDDPFAWLDAVKNAGSIFMGRNCPEALGDYLAGPNHTLPTSGTARFSSPLSVDDFVKKSQFTYYTADALTAVAEKIDLFARQEGLQAHGRSAKIRSDKGI